MHTKNDVTSAAHYLPSNRHGEPSVADLTKKISGLPELHRLVIGLWYDEGLSASQIGQVLNMPAVRVERLYTESVKLLAAPSLGRAA